MPGCLVGRLSGPALMDDEMAYRREGWAVASERGRSLGQAESRGPRRAPQSNERAKKMRGHRREDQACLTPSGDLRTLHLSQP